MALTYAGVPLIVATQEMALWIAANITTQDVYQFARRHWPGRNLRGLTFTDPLPTEPIKVGTLQWPSTATRWAVAHFLVTDNRLAAIRSVLNAGGSGTGPTEAALVMTEVDAVTGNIVNDVTTFMYMLPPRPLSQLPNLPPPLRQLYLITLVDERFYWWRENTGHPDLDATNQWLDLYNWLAGRLGINIFADALPPLDPTDPTSLPIVGRPDNHSELNRDYEDLPLVLDAVAYNVGHRIVRDLDGVVTAQKYDTSRGKITANLTGQGILAPTPKAGGQFIPGDLTKALPLTVAVSYPMMCNGIPIRDFYTLTMKASDGSIVTGFAGDPNEIPGPLKQFHDLAWARFTGSGGVLSNTVTLQALARQTAINWHYWSLGPMDQKFNGLVPWDLEGLTETVEWTYRLGDVSTRVQRGPWNGDPEELLHQLGGEVDTTFPFWGLLGKEISKGLYAWTFDHEYTGGYPDVGWDQKAGKPDGTKKDTTALAEEVNLNTGLTGCIVLLYPGDDCKYHFDQCCKCVAPCSGTCDWAWDDGACVFRMVKKQCLGSNCHCQYPSPTSCPDDNGCTWTGLCAPDTCDPAIDNCDTDVLRPPDCCSTTTGTGTSTTAAPCACTSTSASTTTGTGTSTTRALRSADCLSCNCLYHWDCVLRVWIGPDKNCCTGCDTPNCADPPDYDGTDCCETASSPCETTTSSTTSTTPCPSTTTGTATSTTSCYNVANPFGLGYCTWYGNSNCTWTFGGATGCTEGYSCPYPPNPPCPCNSSIVTTTTCTTPLPCKSVCYWASLAQGETFPSGPYTCFDFTGYSPWVQVGACAPANCIGLGDCGHCPGPPIVAPGLGGADGYCTSSGAAGAFPYGPGRYCDCPPGGGPFDDIFLPFPHYCKPWGLPSYTCPLCAGCILSTCKCNRCSSSTTGTTVTSTTVTSVTTTTTVTGTTATTTSGTTATTTTVACINSCTYTWNITGGGHWVLTSNPCTAECPCPPAAGSGGFPGQGLTGRCGDIST